MDSLAPDSPIRLSGGRNSMPVPERKSKAPAIALAVLLALLAAAATYAAFRSDGWVRQQVISSQGKGWKKSADYRLYNLASKYGDWPELMALGAVGKLAARSTRSRDWKRILVTAMVASTVAGMLVNAVRLTTGRSRPRESPKIAEGWYGPLYKGEITIGNSKYNSFPSGHTATAIGFAGVIFFARPLLGSLALALALGIGWSRIALGAHHSSDITVAAIVALFMAWLSWRLAERRGEAIASWISAKFVRRS
jgi:membrane-associated phospholipid phosphatase